MTQHCLTKGQRINSNTLGELIRCIDVAKMCPRLSSEAFICIFHLINISEPDVFRWEGLRLLLNSVRAVDHNTSWNLDNDIAPDTSKRKLIRIALEETLEKSIMNESNDEIGCKIMEEMLAEITKFSDLSTADSPMDVSMRTNSPSRMKGDLVQRLKRKRLEIPDSYDNDDSSVFDFITGDDIQREILDIWTIPKSKIVKSKQDDSKKFSLGKKQRTSSGRVTGNGSPLPRSTKSTITKGPLFHSKQSTITRGPLFQSSINKVKQRILMKKKDRLQDSSKKTRQKLQIVVDKGVIRDTEHQIQDKSPHLHSKSSSVIGQQIKDTVSLQNSALHIERALSTPPAAKQPSPETESAPLKADQLAFDKYFNFDDDAIIQSQFPENIFSSPVRPVVAAQPAVDYQAPRRKNSQTMHGPRLIQDSQTPSSLEDLESQVEAEGDLYYSANFIEHPQQQQITPLSIVSGPPTQDINNIDHQWDNSNASVNGIEITAIQDQGTDQAIDSIPSASGNIVSGETRNSRNQSDSLDLQVEVEKLLQNHNTKARDVKSSEAVPISNIVSEGSKDVLGNSSGQMLQRLTVNDVVATSPHPRSNIAKVCQQMSTFDSSFHPHKYQTSAKIGSQIHPPPKQVEPWDDKRLPTKISPSVRRDDSCSPHNLQSRTIQSDPERTIVHLVKHEPAKPYASIINNSLEMSSATTGSRSSPPPIEDDPDLLQQTTELFQNLDDDTLTILHPIILLLIDAIRPLGNARDIFQAVLSAFDDIARNMIESMKTQFMTTYTSRQTIISSLIDSQSKHLISLKDICKNQDQEPVSEIQLDLHQMASIDKALSIIGI